MAIVQRERNRTFNCATEAPGVRVATTLNLHDEDKTQAYDEKGRIIRRDMFKGFTDEQRKRLLFDNQFIAEQKR